MRELTNSEVKIIKYINRHPNRTYTKIFKRFPQFSDCHTRLEVNQFIKYEDPNANLMGNDYDDLNNPNTYQIDRNGTIFLESRKWLNSEYIVSHIVVPIVLAVISTIITLFLTNALSTAPEANQESPSQKEQYIQEEIPLFSVSFTSPPLFRKYCVSLILNDNNVLS